MRVTQATATVLNHSLKLIASVEVERPDDLGMDTAFSLFQTRFPMKNRLSGFSSPRAKLMPKLFISLTYLSPRTMVTGCLFVAFSMKTTSMRSTRTEMVVG